MTLNRSISLSLIVAVAAIAPSAAFAKHGADDRPGAFDDNGGLRADNARDGKRVAGKCTGNSTSKLKVKPDNGRLETEFEVDQNRNGVTWKVTIRRNGHLAVKRNMTTRAPSGSWSLERRLANSRGQDRIVARATSPSGEVCTASVSI
jgi:hypothetical protein